MSIFALAELELFKVAGGESGAAARFGCEQEWYGTAWQRRSGCGPTTVANILWYLGARNAALGLRRLPRDRAELVAFMEDVWQYVTPTRRGIPTTALLAEPAMAYAAARGLKLARRVLEVPEASAERPSWQALLDFVREALGQDHPVAFLNLCNGEESGLDEWHWVTLVSIDCAADGSFATIQVMDNGEIKTSDLSLWYRTTTLGGGFVCFFVPPQQQGVAEG